MRRTGGAAGWRGSEQGPGVAITEMATGACSSSVGGGEQQQRQGGGGALDSAGERNREGMALERGGSTGLEAEATVARLRWSWVGGDACCSAGEEKRESEADQWALADLNKI
jgi:hypothetical protein